MILKNKHNGEILELTYPEFRKRFEKEIQVAFESFIQTELNKTFYGFKDDNSMEFNFYNKRTREKLNLFKLFRESALKWQSHYFQILWNFNNHSNSAWYIEKL